MSGLVGKLVESWLDSINERGYQSAFCSLLCTEGHTVLHNTRHSPIENGKDIITVAPTGERHLIQLKGNPGRRFRQSDFASHLNQIEMLAHLPWDANDEVEEIPYFITNGEVEEEARLAFEQFNSRLIKKGLNPVKIVARGELLARFKKSIETIAPTDPSQFSTFVGMLNLSSESDLDFEILFKFFFELIDSGSPKKQVQFDRLCNSCFILGELIASKRDAARDSFSTIIIRIACLSAILSNKQKYGHGLSAKVSKLYHTFRNLIADAIADWVYFLNGRENNFLQGTPLDDGVQTTFRREVTSALIAALTVEFEYAESKLTLKYVDSKFEQTCVNILRLAVSDMRLWGEASVARYLIVYFALSNRSGGGDADKLLLRLLFNYVHLSKTKHGSMFPNAYYSYDEFVRNFVFPSLSRPSDSINDETFWRRSHLFKTTFLLCARNNWKHACKMAWPEFSKYVHVDVKHPQAWSLFFRPDDNAIWTDKLYDDWALWPEILEEAEEHKIGETIDVFGGDIFLSLVFIAICPYRLNLKTALTVDRMLGDSLNLQDRSKFRDLRV